MSNRFQPTARLDVRRVIAILAIAATVAVPSAVVVTAAPAGAGILQGDGG